MARIATALLTLALFAIPAQAAAAPAADVPANPATAPDSAAGSNPASRATAPASAPNQDAAKPAATDQRPADSSPEVFVPSEEISEDYTVSFPVDI